MRCQIHSDNRAVFITNSSEETLLLGNIIGAHCYPGLVLLLYGGLGMGKTLLTQGIGYALGYKRIKSPTFIILSEHIGEFPLVHADLYRLESASEIESFEFESYIDDGFLLVVEWPELWKNPPIKDRWDINIEPFSDDEGSRQLTVKAMGDRASAALKSIILHVDATLEGSVTGDR